MVFIPTFDTRERRGLIIMRDKITDVGTLAKSVAEGGGIIAGFYGILICIFRQCCNSLLVSRCMFIIIIILYVES